jgi:hypothetical protein
MSITVGLYNGLYAKTKAEEYATTTFINRVDYFLLSRNVVFGNINYG